MKQPILFYNRQDFLKQVDIFLLPSKLFLPPSQFHLLEELLIFIFQPQIILKIVNLQFDTIHSTKLNPLLIMYHQPIDLVQLLFDKYTINLLLHAEWFQLLMAKLYQKEIVNEFMVFVCHLTKKQRDIDFVKVINPLLHTLLWNYEQNNENNHFSTNVDSFQSVVRFLKFISLFYLVRTSLNLIEEMSFSYRNIPLLCNYQDYQQHGSKDMLGFWP